LRYLASIAHLQDVHFLWRPFLRDPDDDMVLECAVASGSQFIVTHNIEEAVILADRIIVLGRNPAHIHANIHTAADTTLELPARQLYNLVQSERDQLLMTI